MPVPDGHIVSGEIKNKASLVNLLKKMFKKPNFGKVDSKYVNAALPEKKTFIKIVEIPEVPENEMKGAVKWAVEKNIPIEIEDAYYDWQIIDQPKPNDGKLNVLISVAPKNLVDSFSEVISESGFIPINLENESTAISRSLLGYSSNQNQPKIIIDLGRSRTTIMIYNYGAIQSASTLEISGHEMTKLVSTTLDLNYQDAEKAKIISGLDQKKSKGIVRKVLEPIILRLVSKINENLVFYDNYVTKKSSIDSIILTGSVSRMFGIDTFLQDKLKMKVSIGNPLVNVNLPKDSKQLPPNNLYSFTTAIGLAIKEIK